jgi:hypothetical protein
MSATAPASHDGDMNHPLMFLSPAAMATLSLRARRTMLVAGLILVVLLGLQDNGPSRRDGLPGRYAATTEVSDTTVSGTTVPGHTCGTEALECRP